MTRLGKWWPPRGGTPGNQSLAEQAIDGEVRRLDVSQLTRSQKARSGVCNDVGAWILGTKTSVIGNPAQVSVLSGAGRDLFSQASGNLGACLACVATDAPSPLQLDASPHPAVVIGDTRNSGTAITAMIHRKCARVGR